MPVCKLTASGDRCVSDNNLYWDTLDLNSKKKCKQTYPDCGLLIEEIPPPVTHHRRASTRRASRKNTRRASRRQNGGARKSSCKQTHVLVRDGCNTYRRVVHGTKTKYIKWDGADKPLSALRGKFRYLDGPLRT